VLAALLVTVVLLVLLLLLLVLAVELLVSVVGLPMLNITFVPLSTGRLRNITLPENVLLQPSPTLTSQLLANMSTQSNIKKSARTFTKPTSAALRFASGPTGRPL